MSNNTPSVFTLIILLLLGACTTTPDQATDHSQQQPESTVSHDAILQPHDPAGETAYIPAIDSTSRTVPKDIIGHHDIWKRIQYNLQLERNLARPRVQNKLAFYSRKQEYLDRVADRARPYIHYIVEELDKRDMPLDLALLPIVESAYQPFAYSRSHAAGIWQFIPGTGRHYGLKQNWWYDGRRDIVAATDAALTYLQNLHQMFDGDWLLAVAAYNGGERTIQRAMQRNRMRGEATDFWSLKLRRETMHYVPSLLAVAEIVARPQQYRISLQSIPNEPYFEIIDAGSQIDMSVVSDLTGMDSEELRILNPGIKKWATDPDGPHHLLIPLEKAGEFRKKLGKLPPDSRVKWLAYRIRQGDTLGGIARKYNTEVSALKRVNRLNGHLIRAGHTLLIPASKKATAEAGHETTNKSATGDNAPTYIIREGDNLWKISRAFGVSIDALCQWNGIQRDSTLRPGETLIVQGADTAPVLTAATSKPENQRVSYTVRSGDSLWLIARRFDVTVEQIQRWNRMQQQTSLKPGQSLEIYIASLPADA